MNAKNHNTRKRIKFIRKRSEIVAIIVLITCIVLAGIQYSRFVSKVVYQESVSHLTEILHQSNNALTEMSNKNLTYLHMLSEYLQNISSENEIVDYINRAQKETEFSDFYFLSTDGNYKTVTGETGYLGLQGTIADEIIQGNDIIMNAVLPGKSQLLVFASPLPRGYYQGFEYDAIAIAYENSDIVKILDISSFQGEASNYVIHSNGRVVIDHSSEELESVYNFFGVLRERSNLSEKEILAFSKKLEQEQSGSMLIKLDGTKYYLIYEKSEIQDWSLLELVPVNIVNASMNILQFTTMVLAGIVVLSIAGFIIVVILRKNRVNLKKKNTEILYRDELFQKLSMNVDDVFLMLDGKTSKVDYVSPNVEKLLGVTVEEIKQDIHVLRSLHPKNSANHDKNYLEGLQVRQQREWEFECVHQKTKEHHWFHIVAMGSEVEKRKKYILVMSDRTADKQMNHALSEAVHAAETANKAKSMFLSNMSHDIRTPMNAIIGFATLAVSNINNQEKVRDYLSKILSSSKHLLSLINDVLDMSRIESGKIHLEETEVSLPEVLHDLKTIVSGQIHAKQLELYMDVMDITDEDV